MFTPNERAVLDCCHQAGRELELSTISRKTSLPRSSAHLALRTLVGRGIVQVVRVKGSVRYRLADETTLERASEKLLFDFKSAVGLAAPPNESSKRTRLVFTDSYSLDEGQIQTLKTRYEIVSYPPQHGGPIDSEVFAQRCAGADVIVSCDLGVVTKSLLNSNPNLKAIVFASCFPAYVDWDACRESGVLVQKADPVEERYYQTAQVEYVLNAMTTLITPLKNDTDPRNYSWAKNLGDDVSSKRVGLLVSKYANRPLVDILTALGCELSMCSSLDIPLDTAAFGLPEYRSFDEIWEWSDVVVALDGVSMSLNEALLREKCPPYLINLSPSLLFDIELLCESLAQGRFSGVAIDCVADDWWEKYEDEEFQALLRRLVQFENAYFTPEQGVFTRGSMERNRSEVFDILMELDISRVTRTHLT